MSEESLLEQALKTVRFMEQECRKCNAALTKALEKLDEEIEKAYEAEHGG